MTEGPISFFPFTCSAARCAFEGSDGCEETIIDLIGFFFTCRSFQPGPRSTERGLIQFTGARFQQSG